MGKLTYNEFKTMGSGSLIDADKLDGFHAAISSEISTIVVRDTSGYIQNGWYNSSRTAQNTSAAQYIYDTGDGYMRKKDLANVKTELVTSAAIISGLGYTPLNIAGGTMTGTLFTKKSNGAIAVADAGGPGIEIQSLDASSAAYMNFHRPGAFAVRFGLDTDNQLKVGGWSSGAIAYKVWNEGNDGTGSGLDADKVDGLEAISFGRAYSANYTFGGSQNAITTEQFITLLTSLGAFNQPYWITRGSWSYASNNYISDTGIGLIHLAGSTVEVMGSVSTYTIRIHVPTTTGVVEGVINSDYIYVNNGTTYFPSWRKLMSTTTVPNIDGSFDNTAGVPTGTSRLNYSGYLYATRVYNAIYNDYAEYFLKDEPLEPGDLVISNPDGDGYIKSRYVYDELVVGIYSDDYAQCIGGEGKENDEEKYAAIGMAGRVRVKVIGLVKKGQLLVASDIPGVAIVSKEYKPGTVIGKVLENNNEEGIRRIQTLILNM
jgi:hypothetical protein